MVSLELHVHQTITQVLEKVGISVFQRHGPKTRVTIFSFQVGGVAINKCRMFCERFAMARVETPTNDGCQRGTFECLRAPMCFPTDMKDFLYDPQECLHVMVLMDHAYEAALKESPQFVDVNELARWDWSKPFCHNEVIRDRRFEWSYSSIFPFACGVLHCKRPRCASRRDIKTL
jgi:hypothetical protein